MIAERWSIQRMPVGRFWIGATSLPRHGMIVAIGEYGLCHLYSPRKERWLALPKTERCNCGVVFLNDRIYLVGGGFMISGSSLASMEMLEICNQGRPVGDDCWATMPEMSRKRRGCGVAVFAKQIAVVGGRDGNVWHKSAEIFHTESKTWRTLPDMTTKREGCAAIAVGDYLFVFGGTDGSNRLCSAECYSLANNDDEWTQLPPMSKERSFPAAASFGNLIVVVGGRNKNGEYLSDVEVFDAKRMEWQTSHDIPDLHKGRWQHGAAYLNGSLHVFGGWNHTTLDTMETIMVNPYEYLVPKLDLIFRPRSNLPKGLWAQIISVCPSNVIHFILRSNKAALDGLLLHRNERRACVA